MKKSSPYIVNSLITENISSWAGGGVSILNGNPEFENVEITHNEVGFVSTWTGNYGWGGGIDATGYEFSSDPDAGGEVIINNSIISHNLSLKEGGGIASGYAMVGENPTPPMNITINNSILSHNKAVWGAVSSTVFINFINSEMFNNQTIEYTPWSRDIPNKIIQANINHQNKYQDYSSNLRDEGSCILIAYINARLLNTTVYNNRAGTAPGLCLLSSESDANYYNHMDNTANVLNTFLINSIFRNNLAIDPLWNNEIFADSPENSLDQQYVTEYNNIEGRSYVEDCSGDGDCCPFSWIGDGYPDCEDQEYGCDLSCYNFDDGDCEIGSNEPGENCGTNIDEDPLFYNPNTDLDGVPDLTLLEGSPCIDAGTTSFSWEGETIVDLSSSEYNGLAPDMGANESDFTNECALLGDANDDGIINVLDVVTLVNLVLSAQNNNPCIDLNNDGILNVLDVVIMVNIILGN